MARESAIYLRIAAICQCDKRLTVFLRVTDEFLGILLRCSNCLLLAWSILICTGKFGHERLFGNA